MPFSVGFLRAFLFKNFNIIPISYMKPHSFISPLLNSPWRLLSSEVPFCSSAIITLSIIFTSEPLAIWFCFLLCPPVLPLRRGDFFISDRRLRFPLLALPSDHLQKALRHHEGDWVLRTAGGGDEVFAADTGLAGGTTLVVGANILVLNAAARRLVEVDVQGPGGGGTECCDTLSVVLPNCGVLAGKGHDPDDFFSWNSEQ